MKKKNLIAIIAILILIIGIGVAYAFSPFGKQGAGEENSIEANLHPYSSLEASGKLYTETATIGAIGDILIHSQVYNAAQTGNTYDFVPILSNVKSMLLEPDYLLANQETILGGVEMGLSSYPTFNSPQEVGDALIDAGVDIFSTANNHSLDKGERGILAEIDYFNRVGKPYVGIFKDQEDQHTLRIQNVNGIKIAYLSYTYGTNGIPVPKGKEYLVNLIDKEIMKEEVHRAKEAADVVIMSAHWGNEYHQEPSSEQRDLAQFLVNEGVDIIFGHHPHVLQPIDWLTDESGRKALVVYSLGNFLSGQQWDYKDIGGLATINIKKTVDESGVKIELSNPTFTPTYVSHKNYRNYRVVPLKNAGNFGLENAQAKYEEIMSFMMEELR